MHNNGPENISDNQVIQAALTVVNLAGALVWRSWLSGAQSSVIWDTRDLPSGLYFYRLSPVDGSPESGKIILQK